MVLPSKENHPRLASEWKRAGEKYRSCRKSQEEVLVANIWKHQELVANIRRGGKRGETKRPLLEGEVLL